MISAVALSTRDRLVSSSSFDEIISVAVAIARLAARSRNSAELRERAASLAIATATEIISSKLDDETSLSLVDKATAEIKKLN